MPQRDRYLPGVPCWIDTSQPDPEAAVDFYAGLFGWEFESVMPPGAPTKYFMGRLRGLDVAAVSSLPEPASPRAMWDTYIAVESADQTAAEVREAGGGVVKEPFDVPNAGRMAVLTDPEGAVFCIWQAREFKGARVVNEPGSVNFNDLHTRDVDGAREFYGAVLGWQTLELGGGFEAWTLPGYGDHLQQDDPDLRKRLAEFGGPTGFEDVVASIAPIADDQPDVPAHWGVTFAVDDADAVAAKAEELGGTLVVPPFDAPWVRMTVVTDPQGATFVASKFVPENADLGSREGAAARAD
jgi:predicted enzyme related to lactoylglutathione lyase